jgi:flagellar protein FlaG
MKIAGTSPFTAPVNIAAPAAATLVAIAAGAAGMATPPMNPVVAAKLAPPEPHKAAQAAKEINDFLKSASAGIEFQIDNQSDRVIVRVVDTETKQLIRQVPSEEMVAISHALDRMTGLLLAQKA